jgi:hypothetical protein
MTVVYQYRSTRISGGGATGSDRMRNCKRRPTRDHKWRHNRNYVLRMSFFFPHFFLTKLYQGYRKWTNGHVTPKGVPLGWGVCMRNRKWRNILPSAVCSLGVTSSNVTWPRRDFLGRVGACMSYRKLRNIRSNVTRRASPGKYGSVHTQPEVHLGCSLGHPRPVIVLYPFLWLSAPFPPFY